MTFHVYHLVDPTDKTIRYVGRCADPKARLRNHFNEARRRQTTDKHRWINALLDAGTMPVLVVVGIYTDAAESRQREADECARHRQTIYNVHDPLRFPLKNFKKGKK